MESLGGIVEYIFLGRKCKSPGSGKIKAGVFISQEELFIPQSDRLCLAEVGQLSSQGRWPRLGSQTEARHLPDQG